MLPRAEQKQQTRLALMDAARHLMECGRGFGSLSLREVAKTAGIVPTGFIVILPTWTNLDSCW